RGDRDANHPPGGRPPQPGGGAVSSPNEKDGVPARGIRRDLSEKGWAPLRYWAVWGTALAVAMVLFYVVLTPIWLGLRAAAWVGELRSPLRWRSPVAAGGVPR